MIPCDGWTGAQGRHAGRCDSDAIWEGERWANSRREWHWACVPVCCTHQSGEMLSIVNVLKTAGGFLWGVVFCNGCWSWCICEWWCCKVSSIIWRCSCSNSFAVSCCWSFATYVLLFLNHVVLFCGVGGFCCRNVMWRRKISASFWTGSMWVTREPLLRNKAVFVLFLVEQFLHNVIWSAGNHGGCVCWSVCMEWSIPCPGYCQQDALIEGHIHVL